MKGNVVVTRNRPEVLFWVFNGGQVVSRWVGSEWRPRCAPAVGAAIGQTVVSLHGHVLRQKAIKGQFHHKFFFISIHLNFSFFSIFSIFFLRNDSQPSTGLFILFWFDLWSVSNMCHCHWCRRHASLVTHVERFEKSNHFCPLKLSLFSDQ